ncbi:hypothetical protein JTE90_001173 [Oedothorax gibbosus]|uniref:Uncharacterized protein n=1 Tax=Oedothorax gibbosus TaxID=931172 RepID=A0AAV6VGT4_9ARAC|nr:hypothetical protein JTE90_001173 [Oedothorax gibbosus]
MPKRKYPIITTSENIGKYFCRAANMNKCESAATCTQSSDSSTLNTEVPKSSASSTSNTEVPKSAASSTSNTEVPKSAASSNLEANSAVEDSLPKKTYNFQQSWKTGRNWLVYVNKAMFCSICQAYDKGPRINAFRDGGC